MISRALCSINLLYLNNFENYMLIMIEVEGAGAGFMVFQFQSAVGGSVALSRFVYIYKRLKT